MLHLQFCADCMSPENGEAVLSKLIACFPNAEWRFPDYTASGEIGNDSGILIRDGVAPPGLLATFLGSRWRRDSPESQSRVFSTPDWTIRLLITYPEEGGARLERNASGQPYITTGMLSLRIRDEALAADSGPRTLSLFRDYALLMQASYGFIMDAQDLPTWSIADRLAGIFLHTLFGPDYVEMIGASRFGGLPTDRVSWLPDGGALISANRHGSTDPWELDQRLAGDMRRYLGVEWFESRANHQWYPKLRNLVIPAGWWSAPEV